MNPPDQCPMSLSKPCKLLDLNPELMQLIQLHLKPRHVLKLMRTNKKACKRLLDHGLYWDRVAAHLSWRGVFFYNAWKDLYPSMNGEFHEALVGKHCPAKWFHMMNLEEGYCQAMNGFLALIPQVMAHNFEYEEDDCMTKEENSEAKKYHNPDKYGMQFYADKPLHIQNRYIASLYREFYFENKSFGNCECIMRLTGWEIGEIWVKENNKYYYEPTKKMLEWTWSVDDMPGLSVTAKRQMISGLMEALIPRGALTDDMTCDQFWFASGYAAAGQDRPSASQYLETLNVLRL